MLKTLEILNLLKTKLALATKWAFGNVRLFLELLLILALLIAGWMYRRQERALADAKFQYGKLADNLQGQITIKDNQITILKRVKGTNTVTTKVEKEYVYLPPEGWFRLDYPTPTPTNPTPEPVMVIKDRGWTLKPGFGFEYGSKGASRPIWMPRWPIGGVIVAL